MTQKIEPKFPSFVSKRRRLSRRTIQFRGGRGFSQSTPSQQEKLWNCSHNSQKSSKTQPNNSHYDGSFGARIDSPWLRHELLRTVKGKASEALVTLATTGNPDPLQAKLGGTVRATEEL